MAKKETTTSRIVDQALLSQALAQVKPAATGTSTLPILGTILVQLGDKITLRGTNLEIGIERRVDLAQMNLGEPEKAVAVPANTFVDLVKALPKGNIKLSMNGGSTLEVASENGLSKTAIKGMDAEEYPPFKREYTGSFEISGGDLKCLAQSVIFSACKKDFTRPVLQGINMTIENGKVTLAATDGYRISARSEAAPDEGEGKVFIIPADALAQVARLVNEGSTVKVEYDDSRVTFTWGDIYIFSQLIDGNFPDWQVLVPKSFKTTLQAPTEAFKQALKQAGIIAREGNGVVIFEMEKSDGIERLIVQANSEETGSSQVVLDEDVQIEGDPLKIAFSVRFALEALETAVSNGRVEMKFNAHDTPALLRGVGDDDFTHIIMPMHIG